MLEEFEQFGPVIEVPCSGIGSEHFKEVIAGYPVFSGAAPKCAHQVADGMEGEGQQVQLKEGIGKSVLSMSEVMLGVITF